MHVIIFLFNKNQYLIKFTHILFSKNLTSSSFHSTPSLFPSPCTKLVHQLWYELPLTFRVPKTWFNMVFRKLNVLDENLQL